MTAIRCCSKPLPPSGTKRPPRPLPKIITRNTVKKQIEHAHMICKNFEDTFECIAAWEHVQELETRLNDIEDAVRYMELDEWAVFDREYDL